MATPPLLIIYQNKKPKTAFLRLHMAGVAGWLRRLPQAATTLLMRQLTLKACPFNTV
jgi:hypothetical protein